MSKLNAAFQAGFQDAAKEASKQELEKEAQYINDDYGWLPEIALGAGGLLAGGLAARKWLSNTGGNAASASKSVDPADASFGQTATNSKSVDGLTDAVEKDLQGTSAGFGNAEDYEDIIFFRAGQGGTANKRIKDRVNNFIDGDDRFPINSLSEASDEGAAGRAVEKIMRYQNRVKNNLKNDVVAGAWLDKIKKNKNKLRELSGQTKVSSNKLEHAFKEGLEESKEMQKEAVLPNKVRQTLANIVDDVASAGKTTTERVGGGSEGVVDILRHPDLPVPVAQKKWSNGAIGYKNGRPHIYRGNDDIVRLINRRKDIYNNSPVFPDVVKQTDSGTPKWYMEAMPGEVSESSYGKALSSINRRGSNVQTIRNIQSDIGPARARFPIMKDERTGMWLHDVRPDNMRMTSNQNYGISDAIPTNDLANINTLSRSNAKPSLGGYFNDSQFTDMTNVPNTASGAQSADSGFGFSFFGSGSNTSFTGRAQRQVRDVLGTETMSDVPAEDVSRAVEEVVANL